MKKLLTLATTLALVGCVAAPTLDEAALSQVRATVPKGDGAVRFAAVAIWLPKSREFKFAAVEPRVQGTAVVTDRSFLFQQWGGPAGMTIVKRIPLSAIRDASMVSFGRSARLVIRTAADTYDAFAVSDGAGESSLGAETTAMRDALLKAHAQYQTSPP